MEDRDEQFAFGDWVRARREAHGLTQADLAHEVGLRQPHISAIEAGTKRAGAEVTRRLREALPTYPTELLTANRERLKRLAEQYGLENLRVFGSVARGNDHLGSDIDLIAHCSGNIAVTAGLFAEEAERLLTVPVDVVFDEELDSTKPQTSALYREAATL